MPDTAAIYLAEDLLNLDWETLGGHVRRRTIELAELHVQLARRIADARAATDEAARHVTEGSGL